ncbi:MAG: ATP-dependent metallopeptidase FtsH/Yme1/Tma family protein, partial [Chloroflexota bacterium]
MWLVFLVFLVGWNLFLFLPIGAPSSASIPYSDFVTQANGGNVASVQFKGQSVTGSFVEPIVLPAASAAQPSASSSAAPVPSRSAGPTSYQTFSTVVPPGGDPNLLPLLEQHKVVVSAVDTATSGS